MKQGFFNFLLIAVVSFAIGVLTFLIGRDSLGLETGSMAAAGFAGIASGVTTDIAYELGVNNWSNRTANIICGLVGAFVGGVKSCAGGITAAVFFGYIASLIAKPKIKKQ